MDCYSHCMNIADAKRIMRGNFVGPEELGLVSSRLNIVLPKSVPAIPYDEKTLQALAKDHVLILGVARMADGTPLTLNSLRDIFGVDPAKKEPCFYNQDWYVKEKFADKTTLKNKWYVIRKSVARETRGLRPDTLEAKLKKNEQFPSAILTAYTFFAYYYTHDGAMLWKNDFIWCSDKDKNGDRIYTGRYIDPKGVNKNGFNVHRHLSIRPCYGVAVQLI